jgi:hypothetical protein
MSEIEALHLACAFDMRVPEPRPSEVQQLVALINEQSWIRCGAQVSSKFQNGDSVRWRPVS